MSIRTPELAETIEDGLSAGVTLRELCRRAGVSYRTIYRWIEDDADFKARIACARALGYEAIAEECFGIADDASNDWMMTESGPRIDAEHVQRSKLRIETRLKLLAKWDPKRYGDKIDHNHSGDVNMHHSIEFVDPNGEPPVSSGV